MTPRPWSTADPFEAVPEADHLDQHTPLGPDPTVDEHDAPISNLDGVSILDGVSEADMLDQHTPLPDPDDDYPYGATQP